MPIWIIIAILGVIEGITEFLPVSSTGHLLIAERWLDLKGNLAFQALNQGDLFNVVIQSGAVLAVLPLFPERLRQFVFKWRDKATQDYLAKILVAFVITGIGGLILEKLHFKLPEELPPVAWALLVGGIGFVAVETWLRGRTLAGEVTWAIAIAVGLGQLVAAVFPGTSRSGITILVALVLGLNRVAATEFTFLVGIPTMLAASGLKIFKALHHPVAGAPHEDWGMVALGFLVAAVVSFIAVKWLLRYVQTHTFILFGWYRIGLAALIAAMLLLATKPSPPVVTVGQVSATAGR
jgi:undecaprenyl-diphosphatase